MSRTILIVDDDREFCDLVGELRRSVRAADASGGGLEVFIAIPLSKALHPLSVS